MNLSAQYRLEKVTRAYPLDGVTVSALRGVDMQIERGEFIVLLGPSGSGKSTLLNILGALDQPTTGSVWFSDKDLTHCDDPALTRLRRDKIGFIFQAYNLSSSLTALENIRLATDVTTAPMDAMEALSLVGLTHRANHFPAQLSGGEQQRVAIARAIAKRPEVLLCDEPTGALDCQTGIQVLETIQDIHQRFGTTIVVITHNAVIGSLADRVCHMQDGRIVNQESNPQRARAAEVAW